MNNAAAIQAEFADYRPVKSRAVLQVIMEVPIERQADVFAALGYPMPHQGIPCAIARLNPDPLDTGAESRLLAEAGQVHVDPPAGPKPPHPPGGAYKDLTRELAAKQSYRAKTEAEQIVVRAVLICRDPEFQRWTHARSRLSVEPTEAGAARYLRIACGVKSRSELAFEAAARQLFLWLESEFLASVGKMAELRS